MVSCLFYSHRFKQNLFIMLSTFLPLLLSVTVSVTNPSKAEMTNQVIEVGVPAEAGTVNSANFKENGTAANIAYQLEDQNQDGHVDFLAFQLPQIKGKKTRTFEITFSDAPATTKVEAKTSAYMKLNDKNKKHPKFLAITFPRDAVSRAMYDSFYGHGAVLENLYSAIRVYMDNRQSVDLYAKHTPQLELATTGFYTTRAQMEEGYGRDILWAGTSVALGSFRAWYENKPLTIDSVTNRGERIIADGPIRSIIEVFDNGWVATPGAQPVDMTQRYTTYADRRDYTVDIQLNGLKTKEVYCTGIQKLMNDNVGFINKDGLAGSWGWNIPDKGMAEVTDTLGLGIYVAPEYLAGTLEDDVNYLTLLKPNADGHIQYHFTSAALRDVTSPRTAEAWFAELKKWQKTVAISPIVEVKINK